MEMTVETTFKADGVVVTAGTPPTPVFVFGSNEKGIHGGGAARVAREKHGAVLHQGFGPQGNSFAIPTCSLPTGEPNHEIERSVLNFYINCFLLWAIQNPQTVFQVTQIGCGLAGWTIEEVAPMFANAPANCQFDTAWQPILGDEINGQPRKYWGHVG
jgi:hypothetical protein